MLFAAKRQPMGTPKNAVIDCVLEWTAGDERSDGVRFAASRRAPMFPRAAPAESFSR